MVVCQVPGVCRVIVVDYCLVFGDGRIAVYIPFFYYDTLMLDFLGIGVSLYMAVDKISL